MSSTTSSTPRNAWITRGGAALFLALAVGLLLSQGSSIGAGYGAPAPACAGYHQVCKAQVAGVATHPRVPKAGKGFAVSFTTSSGGKYVIAAKRKHAARSVVLSRGVAGTGALSVKRLGKKLHRGSYTLVVTVTTNATKAHATHALRIVR